MAARLALACILLAACGDDGGGADAATEVAAETDASQVAPDVEVESEVSDETADDVEVVDETRDAETVSETSDADAEVDVPIDPPSSGYPAAGLLVRIADPGANGVAEVTGGVVRVAGMLFGDADTMVWQSGDQSGAITPEPFWSSGPITMRPGDNTVIVTAVSGATSVSDRLVITYNPGFRFDGALVARPSVWWVGEPIEAVFTVAASLYKNIDTNELELVRVDAEGTVLETHDLRDDGLLSGSGDEIEGDGVFSWTGEFTCTTPEPMFFRATARVATSPAYTAVSSTIRVDCLARTTQVACESHQAIIDAAGLALEGGADVASVVAQIGADLSVRAVGPAEDGAAAIWIEFDDGLLGAVLGAASDTRGGGLAPLAAHGLGVSAPGAVVRAVGATPALVMSPFAATLGDSDEGPEIATLLEATTCPSYEVEGGAAALDDDATIARLRGLSRYGIVALATHGAALFGGDDGLAVAARLGWAHLGPQEVLWSGSPVRCDALLPEARACIVTSAHPQGNCPEGTRCLVTKGTTSDTGTTGEGVCADDTQADLLLGRAVMTNRGLAVTPAFFTAWRGPGLPSSYVHLGACHSLYNGTLASALFAAGADAITGFSGTVASTFAHDKALEVFSRIGTPGTIGDFHTPAVDPAHPETRWRLFGASDLALDQAELVNADFEIGNTQGWSAAGDGRVVAQFGDAEPIEGKYLAVISTGLGYSTQTGRLTQDFCIPQGRTTLTLWWRFYSEEFREWCGSPKFQDKFQATLEDISGRVTNLVDLKVDDLCQYQDGTCGTCDAPVSCDPECFGSDGCNLTEDGAACTGVFNCECGRYFEGLSESDIGFDKQGVYRTAWRKTVLDVSSLAGRGPVVLELSVQDEGDSAWDTAVLIDAIAVE